MNASDPPTTTQPESGTAPAPAPQARVYLKDLVLPPEVAAEAAAYCRELGLWWWERKARRSVEEHFKLSYFYGGQRVNLLPTPQGLAVVYVGRIRRDEFPRLLPDLTAEERQQVVFDCPQRWNEEEVSQILHVISHD
jgi:hypothetical protein